VAVARAELIPEVGDARGLGEASAIGRNGVPVASDGTASNRRLVSGGGDQRVVFAVGNAPIDVWLAAESAGPSVDGTRDGEATGLAVPDVAWLKKTRDKTTPIATTWASTARTATGHRRVNPCPSGVAGLIAAARSVAANAATV
jgi:hypothetical protein